MIIREPIDQESMHGPWYPRRKGVRVIITSTDGSIVKYAEVNKKRDFLGAEVNSLLIYDEWSKYVGN